MSYFAITYDLINQKDYQKLWDEMERLNAIKSLNSFYLLEASNTATQIKNHLENFIDDDDRVMVIEFSIKPAYNIALQGTNAWVDARF